MHDTPPIEILAEVCRSVWPEMYGRNITPQTKAVFRNICEQKLRWLESEFTYQTVENEGAIIDVFFDESIRLGYHPSIYQVEESLKPPKPYIEVPEIPYATKGRLNRMFKYFRGKSCRVDYEYNDSMGGHRRRGKPVTYDSFEIREIHGEFAVFLRRKGEVVWTQEFNRWWQFTGLGELRMSNSGPYCYFTIKKI